METFLSRSKFRYNYLNTIFYIFLKIKFNYLIKFNDQCKTTI